MSAISIQSVSKRFPNGFEALKRVDQRLPAHDNSVQDELMAQIGNHVWRAVVEHIGG